MFSNLHSLGGEGWGCFVFYTVPGEEGREGLAFYTFSGGVFFTQLPYNFKHFLRFPKNSPILFLTFLASGNRLCGPSIAAPRSSQHRLGSCPL